MKQTDEIILIEKLRAGKIDALEEIFDLYYANLCKFLSLIFKNKIEVENISQDLIIYLWDNRNSIVIKENLESYLYSAGKYKALNQIRNSKNHYSLNKLVAPENEEVQERIDFQIEAEELHLAIEKAVSKLPKRCQQIFRMSSEGELTNREIADLMGLSINTIEGQITIAYKKLKKILRPYYLQNFLN